MAELHIHELPHWILLSLMWNYRVDWLAQTLDALIAHWLIQYMSRGYFVKTALSLEGFVRQWPFPTWQTLHNR